MKLQSLAATLRKNGSKNAARRVRRTGSVPAVLYGEEKDPVSLSIDYTTFQQIMHGEQGEHAIVEVKVENNPEFNCPAMIKAVQHHPVKDTYVHADLMRIDLKKKIRTLIAIKLEGAAGCVSAGAVPDNRCRDLEVDCLAVGVPDHLIALITELDIGHSLHVGDLSIPDGVEVITPADRSVVAVHAPRVIEEAVTEDEGLEEGVEGVEGAEAAEGAEGAAADSGDAKEGKDSD